MCEFVCLQVCGDVEGWCSRWDRQENGGTHPHGRDLGSPQCKPGEPKSRDSSPLSDQEVLVGPQTGGA